MNIKQLDQNFMQNDTADAANTVYYGVTQAPFELYGVFYDEERARFLRMPQHVADSVSDGVSWLNRNTAGGRVRFSTDSSQFVIAVKYDVLDLMSHMPLSGSAGFVICENTQDGEIFLNSMMPDRSDEKGYLRRIELPGTGMRDYTLYFPLYNEVTDLILGFDKSAKVDKGRPYRPVKPILYYGSSITQGACANRPDTSYQPLISKKNGIDYINLGFSGNAKAEDEIIEYLTGIDCSVAVLDYDHNAPSAEYLAATHFRLYEKYRSARPDTPIVFISKPDFHNDAEGLARVRIIRATYQKAKKAGDKNVWFIDGRRFFGKDWPNCTVDRCHPTDNGFHRMAAVIGKVIDDILNR